MTAPQRVPAARLEITVGRVLRFGVLTSSLCLGFGLVLGLLNSESPLAGSLLSTGLLLLLATPAARVVVSLIDYAREHDWLFVTLTIIVLFELAASVLAAFAGGGQR